jgi:hypothetical protein
MVFCLDIIHCLLFKTTPLYFFSLCSSVVYLLGIYILPLFLLSLCGRSFALFHFSCSDKWNLPRDADCSESPLNCAGQTGRNQLFADNCSWQFLCLTSRIFVWLANWATVFWPWLYFYIASCTEWVKCPYIPVRTQLYFSWRTYDHNKAQLVEGRWWSKDIQSRDTSRAPPRGCVCTVTFESSWIA